MTHDANMQMPDLKRHLLEHAKMIRQVHSMNGSRNLPKFVSVEEFVAANGRDFGENHALPDYLEQGEIKQCFTNASQSFSRACGELAYVEGIAVGKKLGFPVHHAWLVDEDGKVYDPTWTYGPGEALYYGVPIADQYVFETLSREGYYGLFTPCDMYNRRLFDGTDGPEVFLHPWFIDDMLSEMKNQLTV